MAAPPSLHAPPSAEPAPGPARPPVFRWSLDEPERASLYPIRYKDIWEFRKKMERARWTIADVGLGRDRLQWERSLTPDERHTVGMQLAFFSQIDNLVLQNLTSLSEELDCLEARMAYAAQEDQECVHMESYNSQIEAVIADASERKRMLEAARHLPIVGEMHAWVRAAFAKTVPLGRRMVAAAFTEGVLFCASFAIMQWLRERNVLPGIAEVNSYIARDENIHTELTCLLLKDYLLVPPPARKAQQIFTAAMDVADRFVDQSLPRPLTGMNASLMRGYVRFQADAVLFLMGAGRLFREPNPFAFMDKQAQSRITKSNFFEERATQYQQPEDARSSALRLAPPLLSED
jgi:ribonucleotide reductase beta subunit family protein with ferritin-like domain